MNNSLKIIAILSTLLLFSYTTENAVTKDSIDVLFIGNGMTSYNDMPQILQKMLNGQKQKYTVLQSTYFDIPLEKHFTVQPVQNGEGVRYHPLATGEVSSTETLLSKNWDYVVLQDYRLPSIGNDGMINIVPTIQRIQKMHSNNVSEFVLFKMWPNLDPYPKDFGYVKTVKTLDEEVDLINLTYDSIASETHISKLPVANCFMYLMKYKNINLHDGKYYPSNYGAYLNACIFYKHFTKQNATTITYTADFDSITVRTIQEAVDKVYP
jgi:hypothetical protein